MVSLRSLRLSLRFIIPLALALVLLAYAVMPLVGKLTLHWFEKDIDIRSRLIASTLHDPLTEMAKQRDRTKINALFMRAIKDERLFALGFCDGKGSLLYKTPTFPESLGCDLAGIGHAKSGSILKLAQGSLYISTSPIEMSKPEPILVLSKCRFMKHFAMKYSSFCFCASRYCCQGAMISCTLRSA